MAEITKKALGNKLIEKLDIVFATAKTRDYFIKDMEFQRLIGKQILILSYLGMTAEADRFKEIATGTSKTFEVPKYTAPATIEDAADEINFLDIYIKNTFKKDLLELRDEEIKAKQNPPPPVQQGQGAIPPPVPNSRQNGYGRMQQNPFAGNPFMGGGFAANMRPHPLQDPNFYPYTTKPKYMPIARNMIGAMFILLALAQVLIIIGQAINKYTVVAKITNTAGQEVSIYYPYANSIIIPIIVVCLLAYMGYTYLRPTQYDRVKYRVNASGAITTILIFAILSIINDFWIGNTYNVLTQRDKWLQFGGNSSSNINLLFASQITFYAVCAVSIIFAAVVQYFNPPVDQEKVMMASQEWFEQVQGGHPDSQDQDNNS